MLQFKLCLIKHINLRSSNYKNLNISSLIHFNLPFKMRKLIKYAVIWISFLPLKKKKTTHTNIYSSDFGFGYVNIHRHFCWVLSFLPSQSLGNLSVIHFYLLDSYLLRRQCSRCFFFSGKGHCPHIYCPMLS